MRLLWHGIGPGHATGYGQMTREFTRRLRDAGHEVVIALMSEPERTRDGHLNRRSSLNHPDHAVIPESGLGSKIGLDATNKWPPETKREWGRQIAMDPKVVETVTEKWGRLGLQETRTGSPRSP